MIVGRVVIYDARQGVVETNPGFALARSPLGASPASTIRRRLFVERVLAYFQDVMFPVSGWDKLVLKF